MRQKREKGVVSIQEQIRRDDEDQAEWESGERRRRELPIADDAGRMEAIGMGKILSRDGRMHPMPRQARVTVTVTLDPSNSDMLMFLTARYSLARGRVVDALFEHFARGLDKKDPKWRDDMAELTGRVHKRDRDAEALVDRLERMKPAY